MEWIKKIKPGLPKIWLLFTAGLMWTAVGIYLISLTVDWIFSPTVESPWMFWLPGLGLAYLIYQFGFSKLAHKNNLRINKLPVEKPCLFAFQEWHSYPLILFMIGLGISLRHYAPIPKPVLGIMYIGIGGGLASSSIHYYIQIYKNQKIKKIQNHL